MNYNCGLLGAKVGEQTCKFLLFKFGLVSNFDKALYLSEKAQTLSLHHFLLNQLPTGGLLLLLLAQPYFIVSNKI